MALIDSNNFITHLVWSGLIDKATCGELKEAIELCTVKDIYAKADIMKMLKELKKEIEEIDSREHECNFATQWCIDRDVAVEIIQEKIDKLKENKE